MSVRIVTAEPLVIDLLQLPKHVRGAPVFKSKSDGRQLQCDFDLEANDPGAFSVFVRVPRDLMEEFSIGLRYSHKGLGTKVFVRVNGDHGAHRNSDGTVVTGPHIHYPLVTDHPSDLRDRGPSRAYALANEFNDLVRAWKIFAEAATVAENDAIGVALRGLYNIQQDLEF